MAKRIKLFFFGTMCLWPLLAGCRIDFEAESIVRDDGSIERSTVLKVQEETDKKEVSTHYELPAGGIWTESKMTIIDPASGQPIEKNAPSYSTKRIFWQKDFPATDFKRYTESRDKSANNQFWVKVKDRWVVKWFTYEEQFKDVVDRDHVSGILNQVLDHALSQFRHQLSQGLPDSALLDRIMILLKLQYQPLFDRTGQLIRDKKFSRNEKESIMSEVEKFFTAEATYQLIVAEIPEFDNPSNQELVTKAFQAAELAIGNEMEPLKESIFGIHGFGLFTRYPFEIQVKMPGKILKTNAVERKGDALIWKFDGDNLEQNIFVESRKIYPFRVIVLIGLSAVIVFVVRKRKGNHV